MAEAGTDPPQLDMSTAITDSNHGIVVTVVAWICFVASVLFFAARMRIRWPLKSLFGQDDAACTAAMVGRCFLYLGKFYRRDSIGLKQGIFSSWYGASHTDRTPESCAQRIC